MQNLRWSIALLSLCAIICNGDFLRDLEPEPLPRLTSNLSLQDEVEPFVGDTVYGNAVTDGTGKITVGNGKRDQVLAAFGPPPAISFEGDREMWCYRLPRDSGGQRLHLTVCFEGWLGMDELYGFTLGKSKWVVFDEPNMNPSPPADVWKI
ncbi:MAG: hypothetical protein KF760_09250 [Candidatus Eremiobacteraeota bacterium]|nr:hypothetical protein [Candidatus Eremiobacteraeota bacterium]MCW5869407.1 hypothetical protein [Candidatus Eremiobacteraeota bacterium]